jgi:hypothetical protein
MSDLRNRKVSLNDQEIYRVVALLTIKFKLSLESSDTCANLSGGSSLGRQLQLTHHMDVEQQLLISKSTLDGERIHVVME